MLSPAASWPVMASSLGRQRGRDAALQRAAPTPSSALTSMVVKCPGVPSSALADSGSNATTWHRAAR